MKDMRVEVKISTNPNLLDELLDSNMFPVMTTFPLIPLLHAAQLPVNHIASLYNASYHSVPLTIKKVLQCTSLQHSTTTEPHGFCTEATFQAHLYHV